MGAPTLSCRNISAQPALAAIIVFALLQQTVLLLSSRGEPPCPTLPQADRLLPQPPVVVLDGNLVARRDAKELLRTQDFVSRVPTSTDGERSDAYGPSRTDGAEVHDGNMGGGTATDIALPQGMSVATLAEGAKKQMSDLVSLADRNDNALVRENFAHQALRGKDKFPHAGPDGCVSVREVTKHYCRSLDGNKRATPCATKSTDCKHIYGCAVCKEGSAQLFPEDVTNCMGCKDGFVLEEGGFGDCTGVCRPLEADEKRPVTTEATTTPYTDDPANHEEYRVKLIADKSGHQSPMACTRLNFTDDDVAKWRESDPLVIMITTLVAKPSPEKEALQAGAAATWGALYPDVITLVAVDTEDQVVPDNLPRILCPSNKANTPYVANLFGEAERLARETGAVYAGYTNGDIALDDTLIAVLDYLDRSRHVNATFPIGRTKKLAVVGKRLNVDSAADNIDEIIALKTIKNKLERRERMRDTIMKISRKRRNYWMTDLAEDFFFYEPGSIEWDKIPNYVIGRVGWDSFFTQYLLDRDDAVDVIDASRLIHAAHLTGMDGNAAGWNTKREDKHWNYCALSSACESANETHYNPMCSQCFRCKLGGLHQTRTQLTWLDKTPPGEYYQYAVEPRVRQVEDRVTTRKRTIKALIKAKVGFRYMSKFIDLADPRKTSCPMTPGPNHTFTVDPNCCSIMGGTGVDYEMGMRWQVRAEWPLGGWYTDW